MTLLMLCSFLCVNFRTALFFILHTIYIYIFFFPFHCLLPISSFNAVCQTSDIQRNCLCYGRSRKKRKRKTKMPWKTNMTSRMCRWPQVFWNDCVSKCCFCWMLFLITHTVCVNNIRQQNKATKQNNKLYPAPGSVPTLYNGMPAHFADSPKTEAVYKMLSVCQPSPAPEAIAKLYRPASKVDKTHIHTRYRSKVSQKKH